MPHSLTDDSTQPLLRLRAVIAALRTPGTGCPWDLQQTTTSMAPYLLEEAYEAVEAIESNAPTQTCEELGDVLMNVFLIANIAEGAGSFSLDDVARGVADKLIRRHPHVFGNVVADDANQVLRNWEAIKRQEVQHQEGPRHAGGRGRRGVLAGVPRALPALLQALRIGEKAARVGFDWPDRAGPAVKLREELAELDAACETGDRAAIAAELGDVLFSLVNVARHWGVNPEMALRRTSERFTRRFAHVETKLGDRLPGASLAEMEAAWQEAKAIQATQEP